MSPDQIRQRLRELGISPEEAVQRAREMGIDVGEYLSRFKAFPTTSTDTLLVDTTGKALLPLQPRLFPTAPETAAVALPQEVPGFTSRTGAKDLAPFGYAVFNYPASTFEPVLNVATPPSYILGPGDELIISVWGQVKLYFDLTVDREGRILVPDVGPVTANGLTVQQFRDRLVRRMTQAYSGMKNGAPGANTFLDVSLGRLRTIQVFVLGEAVRPGGYTLSSMSTAFHAVYLAGGPTVKGTLRSIRIIRANEKPLEVDLYDYLIRGDRTKDPRLQDGDVVFIGPAGKRVAVAGRVVRPAIYELDANETLGDAVALAGGLLFDSYFKRVHIERIIPFDQRSSYSKNILDVDIEFKKVEDLQKSTYRLQDGDIVSIQKISEQPENRVTIEGNVNKPGIFEWKDGMKVGDLILLADSLKLNTFSERGTLFRLLPNMRHEVLGFNPRLAVIDDPLNNLVLQNEDSVVIYEENKFFPEQNVRISGAVRHPGVYPRYDNMTAADLVIMAGGITEAASLQDWEIARVDTSELGVFSKVYKFGVTAEYWNDVGGGRFELHDFDHLSIPYNPKFSYQKSVIVTGYVLYPGTYAIKSDDERVSDIIRRAGGFRPGYYLDGSRLYRRQGNAGLVPIEFSRAVNDPHSGDNITLQDRDSIYVAKQDEVVYVRGHVFVPSAVVYKKGASLGYYIEQAGGYMSDADEGKTVVTMPNGRKWNNSWFLLPDPDIPSGSTILVPQKIEKPDNTLEILRDTMTILASLAAITVALVQVTK